MIFLKNRGIEFEKYCVKKKAYKFCTKNSHTQLLKRFTREVVYTWSGQKKLWDDNTEAEVEIENPVM